MVAVAAKPAKQLAAFPKSGNAKRQEPATDQLGLPQDPEVDIQGKVGERSEAAGGDHASTEPELECSC